jgi:hypothetical protein
MDASLPQTLFVTQGLPFVNYQASEKLWAEQVASRLPAQN